MESINIGDIIKLQDNSIGIVYAVQNEEVKAFCPEAIVVNKNDILANCSLNMPAFRKPFYTFDIKINGEAATILHIMEAVSSKKEKKTLQLLEKHIMGKACNIYKSDSFSTQLNKMDTIANAMKDSVDQFSNRLFMKPFYEMGLKSINYIKNYSWEQKKLKCQQYLEEFTMLDMSDTLISIYEPFGKKQICKVIGLNKAAIPRSKFSRFFCCRPKYHNILVVSVLNEQEESIQTKEFDFEDLFYTWMICDPKK